MKHIKYISIAVILLASSVSCKKSYLDVKDNTVILREQFVTDLTSLQQYLNGLYITLARDVYNAGLGYPIYTDLISDNIKPGNINTVVLIPSYRWSQIASSLDPYFQRNDLWRSSYQLIRSCSYAIDKAEMLKGENIAKSNQIKAEACSLRALAHFILVNTFAQSYNFTPNGMHPGVPYVTNWDWNDPFSRNTVKEVYDGMIKDLETAVSLLPASSINKLAMNHYAAKALLARICLFKEDWDRAKILATEVATAVPLLESTLYPAKLFTPEETEALFQLAPSSRRVLLGSYDTNFPGALFSKTQTLFLATKDIADLLDNDVNDRRKVWIRGSGSQPDTIAKFPVNIVSGFTIQSQAYYPTLLRSSEMFLTVAEAAAKMGDEGTARIYLDAIRKRANLAASASTATGAELLDVIQLERRKELAFEGFRMWDLLRWKKGVNRTDAAVGAPLTLSYPSNKAIAPIPFIDVNNGIPQNPSY